MDKEGKVDRVRVMRTSDQLNKQAAAASPPLSNVRLDSLSSGAAKLFSDGVKVEVG